nr:unnamed protein product [Spirometra erinaceieuropaei]
MTAPAQLQFGLDAENSRLFQYIRVGDRILSPQLQHPSDTAEVRVVESSCLLLVHRRGLRSTLQRRQDDRFVHLQFGAEAEAVPIPNCVLQTAECLTGFGNLAGDFIVDFIAGGSLLSPARSAGLASGRGHCPGGANVATDGASRRPSPALEGGSSIVYANASVEDTKDKELVCLRRSRQEGVHVLVEFVPRRVKSGHQRAYALTMEE